MKKVRVEHCKARHPHLAPLPSQGGEIFSSQGKKIFSGKDAKAQRKANPQKMKSVYREVAKVAKKSPNQDIKRIKPFVPVQTFDFAFSSPMQRLVSAIRDW
jgi:hypothetical protein